MINFNLLTRLLNALVILQGVQGAAAALRAPVSPFRRLVLFAFHVLHAKHAMGVVVGRRPETGILGDHRMVTPTDAILLATAILGPAAEGRLQYDLASDWRKGVETAIGQYLPPQQGLKRFMLDTVRNAPLLVDEQYTEEFSRLEREYARTSDVGEAIVLKRVAQQRTYEILLRTFQHVAFISKPNFLSVATHEEPVLHGTQVFRLNLQRGILDYEVIQNPKGGLSPALTTPAAFGVKVVAWPPDAKTYVSVNGEPFAWRPIFEAIGDVQYMDRYLSGHPVPIDIVYDFEPHLTPSPSTSHKSKPLHHGTEERRTATSAAYV